MSNIFEATLEVLPPHKKMLRWWGYNCPVFRSRIGYALHIHAAARHDDYIIINDGRDWYPLYKKDTSSDTLGILNLIIEKHGQADTSPKY